MVLIKDVLRRMGLVESCLTKELFERKMEFAGHVLPEALVGQCIMKL